ncbi:MAG: hypothetical protein SVU32_08960, partial [Candidatus Nanohaloarchaea archaeon]|nr:hypothetical protein [Candidatus Nanohaloarchaea archaeon]
GNNTVVNRQGTVGDPGNRTNLTVVVRDTDRNQRIGAGILHNLSVTTSNTLSSYTIIERNLGSNASGYVRSYDAVPREFAPGCSFQVGYQGWKVSRNGGNGLKAGSSGDLNLSIVDELHANVTYPIGASFNSQQDTSITINATLNDSCQFDVTNAKVIFNITKQSGSTFYTCGLSEVSEPSPGVYECTLTNLDQKEGGTYDVTVEANKTPFYFADTDTQIGSFTLTVPPTLTNQQVKPVRGPWATEFNYSVRVSYYTDVNVSAWRKPLGGTSWEFVGSRVLNSPDNRLVNFTETHDPSDADYPKADWVGRFNATKEPDMDANKTVEAEYDVLYDNVSLGENQFIGNNSIVSRQGTDSTLLSVDVRDLIRDQAAINPAAHFRFNITQTAGDPTTEIDYADQDVNGTGHTDYSFDPGCSPEISVGNHRYRFWTSPSKDLDQYLYNTSETGNVSVIGQLLPNITDPRNRQTFRRGIDTANITVNLRDDCQNYVAGASLSIRVYNDTENVEYTCSNVHGLGNGTYYCPFDTTGKERLVYDISLNATNKAFYRDGDDIELEAMEITAPFGQERIRNVYYPDEVVQGRAFIINATVETIFANADAVNATINVPETWQVRDRKKELWFEAAGEKSNVSWQVNPGEILNYSHAIQINVSNKNYTANTTINITAFDIQNLTAPDQARLEDTDTSYCASGTCNVTRELAMVNVTPGDSLDDPGVEALLTAGTEPRESVTASWRCEQFRYRAASLRLFMESEQRRTAAEVYTYNGTDWETVEESLAVNDNASRYRVPILRRQLQPNGTGYCRIRVENRGGDDLYLDAASLEFNGRPDVTIANITWSVDGTYVTGTETSQDLINTTVAVSNSENVSRTLDLNLTVYNTTGAMIYTARKNGITIQENETILSRFENIDTITWNAGTKQFDVTATLQSFEPGTTVNREVSQREPFTFRNIQTTAYAPQLVCPDRNRTFRLQIRHPFQDRVQYNTSIQVPQGWNTTPRFKAVNLSQPGNHTQSFTLTSPPNTTVGNFTINASTRYTFPTAATTDNASQTILSNEQPIINVTREQTPYVANDSIMQVKLIPHNIGCEPASQVNVTEQIPASWSAGNPQGGDRIYNDFLGSGTATWQIFDLEVDDYGLLTYRAKAPIDVNQEGRFQWNATWTNSTGYRFNDPEEPKYSVIPKHNEEHIEYRLSIDTLKSDTQPRSMEPGTTEEFTYTIKNIGDEVINQGDWNTTLEIPQSCSIADPGTGTVDTQEDVIRFNVTQQLSPDERQSFDFNMTCSSKGTFFLDARGEFSTRGTQSFEDNVFYSCTGPTCSTVVSHTFQQPGKKYQRFSKIDIRLFQQFNGTNVTLGDANITMEDDTGRQRLFWQNYTYGTAKDTGWTNTTVTDFPFDETSHRIRIDAATDAMFRPRTNITIQELNYTWQYGKFYEDPVPMFFNVKIFDFVPRVGDTFVEPDVGGWGETFNFTVEVYDQKGRNVTVYLWERRAGTEKWYRRNSTLVEDCSPSSPCNVSLTYAGYTPDNISLREFKFNASNQDGTNESGITSFEVERDDVELQPTNPDQGDRINRSDVTNVTLRVYDLDNESYVSGATGRVYMSTLDKNTFDSPSLTQSNGTGYLIRSFSSSGGADVDWCQDRYPLGPHAYKGVTDGDNAVKDNSSIRTNFTLVGDLINTLQEPDGDANYSVGQTIGFTGFTTNDCGANVTSLAANYTVTHTGFTAKCKSTLVNAQGQITCSLATDGSFPLGWYNVSLNTNKTYYNYGTDTIQNAFYHASTPNFTVNDITPQSGGWGESPFNFSVNVSDRDNNTVQVGFWLQHPDGSWELNATRAVQDPMNTTVYFARNFSRQEIGQWAVKFNGTDTSGFSGASQTQAFTVEKDDIRIGRCDSRQPLRRDAGQQPEPHRQDIRHGQERVHDSHRRSEHDTPPGAGHHKLQPVRRDQQRHTLRLRTQSRLYIYSRKTGMEV